MRKDAMTKNNDNQNCQYMTRRIGSTTYKVKVIFSDNGGETMEENISTCAVGFYSYTTKLGAQIQ